MLAALPAPRDARGMWLSLSRNQRMALGFIGIAAIVVVLAFVTMSRPAEYQVAFSNLRDEDAAAIATKLKEAGRWWCRCRPRRLRPGAQHRHPGPQRWAAGRR